MKLNWNIKYTVRISDQELEYVTKLQAQEYEVPVALLIKFLCFDSYGRIRLSIYL